MAVIIEKAETGAFVTNSSGMGKRNFAPRQRRAPRHGGRKPYAMSMMVKIALCALSCAAALLFRLHGQNDAPMQQAMAETSETQNEDKLDEMLGIIVSELMKETDVLRLVAGRGSGRGSE